jgi:hypothetical protein
LIDFGVKRPITTILAFRNVGSLDEFSNGPPVAPTILTESAFSWIGEAFTDWRAV